MKRPDTPTEPQTPVQSERPLCCSLTIATQDGPIKEGKELSCGCGNRYKFTDGQWRMINPFQPRPSPVLAHAVEPHTNQSCANCGGLLAPASGDTAKHFDGSYYCIANRTYAVVSTTPNEADDAMITYSTKPGCPTCLSPQPHLHPAVQHEGEVSICKDPFHSQVTPQNPKVKIPIGLIWGEHQRDGGTHTEWYAPCGCAFHPEPFPHVHPCSDGHKRPDLHTSGERRLATREDAERFIQRELSSAQWLDENLMISFEKESLIHALVEKWEFAMESSGESKNERR